MCLFTHITRTYNTNNILLRNTKILAEFLLDNSTNNIALGVETWTMQVGRIKL